MALLPYIYEFDPFRMMGRELLSPLCSQHQHQQPRDLQLRSGSYFDPLERISNVVNRLALDKSNITADDEKFQVNVDVQHFAPEEINVKVINGQVIVEGKHEEKRDQHGYISRQFVRKYSLPKGCLPDTVESKLSSDGVLTVTAPKVLPMPSTGEKIVPIVKTGPVRLKANAAGLTDAGEESRKKGNPKSVEKK